MIQDPQRDSNPEDEPRPAPDPATDRSTDGSATDDADWILDVVTQWDELASLGRPPELEALCAERPHLLEEVRTKVDALRRLDRRLDPELNAGPEARPRAELLPRPFDLTVPDLDDLDGRAVDEPRRGLEYVTDLEDLEVYNDLGGLGRIYRGWDRALQRHVAVKVCRKQPGSGSDDGQAARALEMFRQESVITGALDHPGIVSVHGLGTTRDGRPFYVMKLIRGMSLQEAIAQAHEPEPPAHPASIFEIRSGLDGVAESRSWRRRSRPRGLDELTLRRLLNHFVAACRTLAYAHDAGVVHRDIKPDNIMLGRYGETFVLDWGLATPHEDPGRCEVTRSDLRGRLRGDLSPTAGTILYMAPERISNPEGPARPTQDVYSLGGTLYKILTGKPPFDESHSTSALLREIVRGQVIPPRKHQAHVPHALEAICLKAMARSATLRYQNAQEMADEIERYLSNGRVEAYRETPPERMLRFARRNASATVSALVGLMLCLSLVLGGVVLLARSADRQSQTKDHALSLAARYASQAIGQEVNNRWRILELAATDDELIELLTQWSEGDKSPPPDPERRIDSAELERFELWLHRLADRFNPVVPSDSWFLCDANGYQLARDPIPADGEAPISLGRCYAHRDYFHGLGLDLGRDQIGQREITPIIDVHLSATYRSSNTDQLKVALSVPIRVGDQTLGVLGMSIRLGAFAFLQDSLQGDLIAVLADLDDDTLEGRRRPGVILHHPDLLRSLRSDLVVDDRPTPLPRLSVEQLESLNRLRRRLAPTITSTDDDSEQPQALLVDNYRDPVRLGPDQPAAKTEKAAIMPIYIEGRRCSTVQNSCNTGWVIIVQVKEI